MCHCCGAQSMESESCIDKQENGIQSNHGATIHSCRICSEKQENEYLKQEDINPHVIPSISPTASLKSSASSVSNSSDYSVDAYSYGRSGMEESRADSSQEDMVHLPNFSVPSWANGIHSSNTLVANEFVEHSNVNNKLMDRINSDVGSVNGQGGGDSALPAGSLFDEDCESSSTNDEAENHFWIPPEPEDQEDDAAGSITTYDDDDEDDDYGEHSDKVNWRKTDSFVSFEEEAKEEKRKTLNEVMNGKFKALVGQLLKSVGIATSEKAGDSWVDIVTSLSWQAASYIKPDFNEFKAVDPEGYVKIKCIATGSCIQSRLIKGLVFKKHAAHKRMPAEYKNPKFLLIEGSLGLSSSGLSSFQSMQQEKDSQKSIIDMIELYHPNVILVEKTVSRDIQESILAKGMTLVLDMKHHRLQRVARCIGSTFVSSASSFTQKLRHCDSFHFEKFVEEHAPFDESGKRPSKTLMFIEGCPKRVGCTILLMGANSDVLKRVKYAVRHAVVMAYHLILETSFLLDQRVMFSTIAVNEKGDVALPIQQFCASEENVSSGETNAAATLSSVIDIPILNGFHEESPGNSSSEAKGNSLFSTEPNNSLDMYGLSSPSLERFPSFSTEGQSVTNNFDLGDKIPNHEIPSVDNDVQISIVSKLEDPVHEEPMVLSIGEKVHGVEQPHPTSASTGNPLDTQKSSNMDDVGPMLDVEGILVLVSTRNASRGTLCEHRHLSHIKFYRNFDFPLGKFLRDKLLNQRLQCKECSDPPEAHIFYYAHHNKQLTIQVRRLPKEKCLSGETEGKLWMWSRCGKCKFDSGNSKSSKRVLISPAASGLSFGKFLELSFSNNSAFDKPSHCGHTFHRDFLYFFGFGPMVAMFKYSTVATYSVSLPPEKLEFSNTVAGDFLEREFDIVHTVGVSMFRDIENSLEKIRPQFVGVTLNLQGSSKEFSHIDEMLEQERSQFEVELRDAFNNGKRDEAAYKLLSLNRVRLELVIESYVWDQRFHSLLSDLSMTGTKTIDERGEKVQPEEGVKAVGEVNGPEIAGQSGDFAEQILSEEYGKAVDEVNGLEAVGESGVSVSNESSHVNIEPVSSVEASDSPFKEITIDGDIQGYSEQSAFSIEEHMGGIIRGGLHETGSDALDPGAKPNASVHSHSLSEGCQEDNSLLHTQSQEVESVPVATDIGVSGLNLSNSQKARLPCSLSSRLVHDKDLIWEPFSKILCECMHDLQEGTLPKFDTVGSFLLETTAHKLIIDEGSRLHLPLGTYDYILSAFDNELSSVIACALALLKDRSLGNEIIGEEARKEKFFDGKVHENSLVLPRFLSFTSSHWSSTSSLDSDGYFSSSAHFSDSQSSSNLDGLNRLDSLGHAHPEIPLWKLSEKCKFSVICLYASQFRQLRELWCPSEEDYIASLSRCKDWDAKGGKSKSLFAKTLDDRFIIKEIKRTEFDSFVKFAQDYFNYMNQCHECGNQTCLAKILGIYQVIERQAKSGKETKHDLMVMENLSFGRSFARSYDLKGALHARLSTGDVLLDQNFVNDTDRSPLYVNKRSKRLLTRGVWNDSLFLKSIQVMDYSLLVGVDLQRRELVCGIIDYLRQYTWDKQLETWVKSSLVPKNQLPTVISPGEYYKRFRKFIATYFLSVPDDWCAQSSSSPCKLCGPGNMSIHLRPQESMEYGTDSAQVKSPEEGKDEDDLSPE